MLRVQELGAGWVQARVAQSSRSGPKRKQGPCLGQRLCWDVAALEVHGNGCAGALGSGGPPATSARKGPEPSLFPRLMGRAPDWGVSRFMLRARLQSDPEVLPYLSEVFSHTSLPSLLL